MDTEGAIANGRYRLMSVLGEGGQATVYRAWDDRLGVWRAIKRLRPGSPRSLRERFETEARTLARLKHPNLLVVHDVGEDNDQPYMVMDLASESLADRIEREGPLSSASACLIMEAIAGALCVAHSAGVIHRDIKPANILADDAGRPLLSDFGIAQIAELRRTRTDAVMGTPMFMAPEQHGAAATADARADIYALGATLYASITGHEPAGPIEDLSEGALIAIPKALRPLLRKATARAPEQRYPSAEALREALAGVLPALSEGGPPAVWRPPRAQGTPPTEILSDGRSLAPGPTAVPEKSHATYGLPLTGAKTSQGTSLASVLPLVVLVIVGLFGVFVAVTALTAAGVSLWVARSVPAAHPTQLGEMQRLTTYPPDISLELFGFSSDGAALLYREGETGLLWRHPVDGTTPKTRLHPEIEEPILAGYLNEDLYAFIDKDGQLALRDLRSGRVLPFRHAGNQFELSPNADRIAWHDGRSAFQIPVGGAEPVAVFTAPEGQLIHGITWSPDQQWLAFVIIGEMKAGDNQLRVVIADANGMMSSRPIYTSGAIAYTDQTAPIVWPWPGALLVSELAGGAQHLVVVPIDGEPTHLGPLPMQVGQLAARGNHLAVLGSQSMQDTWLAQVGEGGRLLGEPARLWADEDQDSPVTWLQDGSLAYSSDRFRGRKLLAQRVDEYDVRVLADGDLVTVAGRDLVNLLDDGTLERAPIERDEPWVPSKSKRWDPIGCAESGACVAARTMADGIEILAFAAGAKAGSPVEKLPNMGQVALSLSKDGRQVAIVERATESATLHLIDLQEQERREVPLIGISNPQSVAWRTDGEGWWVVTASRKGGEGPVLAAMAPSGEPDAITPLDGWAGRVVPSPDGARVAFSLHRRDVDLWVAELPDRPPSASP